MYARAQDAIERGRDGLDPGSFRLTLATDGEASDGHILSIEGADFPDQLPLLVSHENDPIVQVGSLSRFTRHLREVPKRLRAHGQIEMSGDGADADRRRDLALKIERGHVRGVSVRWEPIDMIPRSELPDGHPARVAEDEPDPRKRFGLYFRKWRALEGSVVSVGADAEAQIGREYSSGETAMRLLARAADYCRSAGLAEEDILNAVWVAAKLESDPQALEEYTFAGRKIMLPAQVFARISRPDPASFGSEDEFMSACISQMVDEGKPHDQAIAACANIWKNRMPAPVAEKPAPPVRVPFDVTIALVSELLERQEQTLHQRLAAEFRRLRGRV